MTVTITEETMIELKMVVSIRQGAGFLPKRVQVYPSFTGDCRLHFLGPKSYGRRYLAGIGVWS